MGMGSAPRDELTGPGRGWVAIVVLAALSTLTTIALLGARKVDDEVGATTHDADIASALLEDSGPERTGPGQGAVSAGAVAGQAVASGVAPVVGQAVVSGAAPVAAGAAVVVDGVVVSEASTIPEHPLLPAMLAALDDELLSSPMLHHPPFAAEVERWVDRWSDGLSEWMPLYLDRMTRYEAMVDGEIAERGLPWSLRYLPVIESGYSPEAVSHAEAVGMWQFMAPTAGDFGIEVSPLVDDRRDPFVSTEAATEYLLRLRDRFGSWFLALAAYNAGPNRVERLLERYLPDVEQSDAAYWALRKVLPEETANFVPNLLGAVIVASDPARFGYEAPIAGELAFDRVPIRGSISFETAARAAGTSPDEIARLNPEYIRGVTPPGRQVDLRLPPGTAQAFRAWFTEKRAAPTGR